FCSSKNRSNSIAIPKLPPLRRGPWDSLNAQAPLAKIDIRSKTVSGIFCTNTLVETSSSKFANS
ncbi:MAG: hypothetical protein ABIG56_05790, partial [Candidatus Omnitrophota bacterium]